VSTFTAVFRTVADYGSAIRGGKLLGKSFTDARREAEKLGVAGSSFGTKVARGALIAKPAIEHIGKSLTLGVTAPLVLMGAAGVRTFAKFETAIVSAGSKSDASAAQLERMKKVALDVGAQTKFSATQAAEGMDRLAAAGMNAEDSMKTLPAVTLAAQAANEDLGQTADTTAKIMNAFNIPAERAGHVADVLTNSLNTTALSLQDVQDAMGQVGEVGPRFHQSLEDTLAVVGRLVDMGVPAASAGVAIRQGLAALAAPQSAKAANLIEDLGLKLRDAEGNMRPLPDLIREIKVGLQEGNPGLDKYRKLIGLNNEELKQWAKENGTTLRVAQQAQQAISQGGKAFQDYATRVIFGVEGAKAFSLAMSDGKPLIIDINKETDKLTRLTDGLAVKMGRDGANAFVKAHTQGDKFVATSVDAVEAVSALNLASDGMAKKIGAAFQKTTAQKIDNLKGSVESLAIALVQLQQGDLNGIIDFFTKLINGVRGFADEHPRITRMILALLEIAAVVGPGLFILAKLIGVVKAMHTAFVVTTGAIKNGIIWMQLYGEAALASGAKIKGGLLGSLGSVAKFLKGPWGIAFAAAALVLGFFVKKHLDAKERMREFKQEAQELSDVIGSMEGEINRQTVAVDKSSRAWVVNRLQQAGALDMANRLGLSSRTVTDAVLGNQEAIDAVNKVLAENLALNPGLSEANSNRRNDAENLSKALGNQSQQEQEAIRLARQAREAQSGAATATNTMGNASLTAAQKQEQLVDTQKRLQTASKNLDGEIDKLSNSFSILRGDTLSSQEANDAFEGALIRVKKEMKGGTKALSDHTAKGLANREMVRTAVKALNDKITANYKDGLTTKNVTKKTHEASDALKIGRKRLIDSMTAATGNRKEAKKMVDQMILTPKELKTKYLTPGLKDALGEIKKLKERIRALEDEKNSYTINFRTGVDGYKSSFVGEYFGHRDKGGRIYDTVGKGRQRYDTVPTMLRVDEHVWTPEEVAAAGGHNVMERMRQDAKKGLLKGYRAGGAVQKGSKQRGMHLNTGAGHSTKVTYTGDSPNMGNAAVRDHNKIEKTGDMLIAKYTKEYLTKHLAKAIPGPGIGLGPGGSGSRKRVRWKGGTFTERFVRTLRVAQALSRSAINVIQGGWRPRTSFSGTSHAGDAIDTSWRPAVLRGLRGAHVAAWHRTPSQGPWGHHIHGVPLPGYGYPKGSGIWQAQDYRRGGNGLARGTRHANAGTYLMGEQGPELGRLPGGTQVQTNRKTLDYLSRIESMAARSPSDPTRLPTSALRRPRVIGASAVMERRPIAIHIDMGDGLVQKIQGVIDENDEFHASVGRASR
jgi:TP901 family phage tail tape measure protein